VEQPVAEISPVLPQRTDNDTNRHLIRRNSAERADLARNATPFFVRGNRGDLSNLSKIDHEKFNEYLDQLETLLPAVEDNGRGRKTQDKLSGSLEKIREINRDEIKKLNSNNEAVRNAALGIENVKAYTNKVTDLLRDAQAGAEHMALKSVGDREKKLQFDSLAGTFLQTKRLVRGVGAEKILLDSVQTIDAKLMDLMSNRPDSSLITTNTVAVTPPHAFSKFTGGKIDSLVVDEQGLLLYFPAKTFSAAGHGTVGLASMTGGLTGVRGKDNFRAAVTFSDLLKTTLIEKADSNWIRSNGPTGRKMLQTLNAVRSGLGFVAGQLHTEEYSPSMYSSDKLGKTRVENVFAINDVVQKNSQNDGWKQRFDDLTNKFFLPVAEDIKIRKEAELPPPANPYDVVTELIKGSYSDHGANFTVQAGKHWDAGKISPGISGTGVLSYDRFHFDMQLPSKPSELLDSTFHQDVRETLKLHDTIIQKLNPSPKSREKAGVFNQYSRMNASFAQLHADAADRDFTAAETDYFGEKTSIRSEFHGPILAPSLATATCIERCLDDLATMNSKMTKDLAYLGSPRGMPNGLKAEMTKGKSDVIKQIHADVWGDAYPGGEKEAMKDTDKFKRQTMYNLEIGLGRVGIELALLNRHHQNGNAVLNDEQLTELNQRYMDLKDQLTSREFMGNPNKDFDYSPLKTTALFNRHQVIASGTLVAGGNLSSLIYSGDVAPSNTAGDLYIKLQAQYENAVNQFDTTREGQFLVLSFELSSGVLAAIPPGGRLQEHAVHAVSKAAMGVVGQSIKNAKVEFSKQSEDEIAQHMMGILGTNVQSGAKVAIKMHKPYANAEWRLQKVTESKTQQGGIDLSVPFVEIVAKDSSTKQEQQIVGPDWSVNKMTIKYLTPAITNAGPIALNNELATRYYSIPNTITQIVDDAMSWTDGYLSSQEQAAPGQSAQAAANQGTDGKAGKKPYPSDIHRFLGDPALVRSGERAPEVSMAAPGPSPADASSPLVRMANLCKANGATPDNWKETKAQWDITKKKIESLKTFEARRAYWDAEGGDLLRTFSKMIEIYTEVTTAAGKHADKTHKPTKSGMTNKVTLPETGRFKAFQEHLRQRHVEKEAAKTTRRPPGISGDIYEMDDRQTEQREDS